MWDIAIAFLILIGVLTRVPALLARHMRAHGWDRANTEPPTAMPLWVGPHDKSWRSRLFIPWIGDQGERSRGKLDLSAWVTAAAVAVIVVVRALNV